ncbi:cupin domain-containing protein [Candidatus Poribacteria bacterium]|nr:cupin domain-containing protein [Candidatus Poribacteria bacterium]
MWKNGPDMTANWWPWWRTSEVRKNRTEALIMNLLSRKLSSGHPALLSKLTKYRKDIIMASVISWDKARLRGKPEDPEGYAKIYVDETIGAKKLKMHISVIKPGMRAHEEHTHEGEEIFFILEGEARITLEGVSFKAGPNTAVFVEGPKMHGISNPGPETLKYMIIIAN